MQTTAPIDFSNVRVIKMKRKHGHALLTGSDNIQVCSWQPPKHWMAVSPTGTNHAVGLVFFTAHHATPSDAVYVHNIDSFQSAKDSPVFVWKVQQVIPCCPPLPFAAPRKSLGTFPLVL